MNSSDVILYAEDDENDVFFTERAFKKVGFAQRLIVVPDGKVAVDYLAGNGKYGARDLYPLPGLVLLDLNMPNRSGLEVLEWIRSEPATTAMVVLVLTASNQESDIHRAYQQGANGYLVKPNRTDEMVAVVAAVKDYWAIHNRAPRAAAPAPLTLTPPLG